MNCAEIFFHPIFLFTLLRSSFGCRALPVLNGHTEVVAQIWVFLEEYINLFQYFLDADGVGNALTLLMASKDVEKLTIGICIAPLFDFLKVSHRRIEFNAI